MMKLKMPMLSLSRHENQGHQLGDVYHYGGYKPTKIGVKPTNSTVGLPSPKRRLIRTYSIGRHLSYVHRTSSVNIFKHHVLRSHWTN